MIPCKLCKHWSKKGKLGQCLAAGEFGDHTSSMVCWDGLALTQANFACVKSEPIITAEAFEDFLKLFGERHLKATSRSYTTTNTGWFMSKVHQVNFEGATLREAVAMQLDYLTSIYIPQEGEDVSPQAMDDLSRTGFPCLEDMKNYFRFY